MKKILYALMMIAMLTPALACGGFMCVKPAQAAEEMPCHGAKQNTPEKQHGLMFMKDCLKVELFQADNGDMVKKPNIELAKFFYGWPDIVADYNFELLSSYQIRGPPIETVEARTYPPLYLTTQRLRI